MPPTDMTTEDVHMVDVSSSAVSATTTTTTQLQQLEQRHDGDDKSSASPSTPTETTTTMTHREVSPTKRSSTQEAGKAAATQTTLLTPATVASETTSSSSSSPPSLMVPSPIDTSDDGVAATAACAAAGASSSSPNSIWVPMPSPSRPRLDPRYAARLAPELLLRSSCSTSAGAASSARLSLQKTCSNGSSTSSNTNLSDADLMPPPGIARANHGIFRPSPIITSSLPSSPTEAAQQPAHGVAAVEQQPRLSMERHYHHSQSLPLSIPTYTTNLSNTTMSGAGGSNSNSSTPSSSASSDVNNNNRPSSTRAGGTTSRRPSYSRSSSDVGVSDRFIPSRATSNFTFNLWESRRSLSRSSTPGGSNNDMNNPNGGGVSGGSSSSASGGASNRSATAAAASAAAAGAAADDRNGGDSHHSLYSSANPPTMSAQSHQTLLNTLLRSELLGENENFYPYEPQQQPPSRSSSAGSSAAAHAANAAPLREGGVNNLRFHSPRQLYQDAVYLDGGDVMATTTTASGGGTLTPSSIVNNFSLTPVSSAASQRLMASPPKRKRRISKVPFKVLDAPALQDDFYLNLVDWSSQNVLAVGLASCVYLWSACTSKVTKLCDLSEQAAQQQSNADANNNNNNNTADDMVTSVSWAQRGTHLAVGTNRGQIQLWDTVTCQKVRDMTGHHARVGTLAWAGPTLASGSRDRLIYLRDVRTAGDFTDKLTNHKQEVCGLKWSFDEPAFLASGGNDNNLHVMDSRNPHAPVHRFSEHSAAVKAIAWSPHQHGLLASGGGTADRCIRFWNTLSGMALNKVDTGSQVCNLAWSQNCNEIVSTHGYSLNQIVVWRYPSMQKVATLTGHTYRVLYLAMSPDGSTVVTGAGDETLRFWQVFPGPRSSGKDTAGGGLLFPNTLGSVIR